MRLRTTLTAGVLAVGVVLGGATTALAHGDDDHGRNHGYGYGRDDDRRHDYGHGYGRDDDRRHDYGHGRNDDRRHDYGHGRNDDRRHDYGHGYGRDDNRHHGYARDDDRDHGRDHGLEGGRKGACHMEGDTSANKGTHYQSDCGWASWHSASHTGY
ncbi:MULTISPECIES: hypothetical protein [unclassified Streptomyces]|uniref:hypothetical protein n=1 Tax=unclassified Streptomyces TaxID=2593676 RepID=UPI0033F4336B